MSPRKGLVRLSDRSLQDIYAPRSVCFGCGPANRKGLRLKSYPRGNKVVADWTPGPEHVAFSKFASGGIISVLLDCNGNWAGTYALMKAMGTDRPPGTVTAEYTVTFLKPTAIDRPWHLSAWAERIDGNRAYVAGQLEVDGQVTAKMKGLFVAVGKGHPAFHRWE